MCVVGCPITSATAISAFREDGIVYLGVDSRKGHVDAAQPTQSTCKIDQISKNQFVAFAGVVDSPDYVALDIAKAAVGDSAATTSEEFVKAIRPRLEKLLSTVLATKETDRDAKTFFNHYIQGEARDGVRHVSPLLDAFVVGFDGKSATMVSVHFSVDWEGSRYRVSQQVIPCEAGCNGADSIVMSGAPGISAVQGWQIINKAPNPTTGILKLLELHRLTDPNEIAPPFDILVVNNTKADYKPGNSEGCPGIEH
jgi:hypothetical protein